MPDISMCAQYKCAKRFECYRYVAKENPHYQSFLLKEVDNSSECKLFWPVKDDLSDKEKEDIDRNRKATFILLENHQSNNNE